MAVTGTIAVDRRRRNSARAHEHDSDGVVERVLSAIAWGFSGIGLRVRWHCCRVHVDLLMNLESDEFGLSAVGKGLEPWVVVEIVELDPGKKFRFRKSFPGCFLQPVERRRAVAEMVVDDGAE